MNSEASFAGRLVDKRELLFRVPLSYPSVWALMRRGEFPRSRRIGKRVFWLENEIATWLENLPRQQLKDDRNDAA